MMAAEKWYEYQECYRKYGLDMRPKCVSKKDEIKKPSGLRISAKDKARLLLLTLFAGLLCICLIITAAYSTKIKFNTNAILAQADEVQGEIENLNVAIKSATNISIIEEKAMNELGMVYPEITQIAFIEAGSNTMPDFALTLKQLAFNK
jgi:cell division protein FtsL